MKLVGIAIALVMTGAPLGSAKAQPASPHIYKVTFDYDFPTLRGEVLHKERVSGTYTRDTRNKTATWTGVTTANTDASGTWSSAEQSPFMQGFSYPLRPEDMTSAAFFRGIPVTAMHERNLVFDTRMWEIFGEEQFANLKPNTPYHYLRNSDINMAGAGTFNNKDVLLTLTASAVWAGKKCAMIDYVALFNTFELTLPNFTMRGRSHYWGQIWVSSQDKQIEHATLYEDVLGEVAQPGGPSTTNVFRIGTIDRQAAR